MLQELTPTVRPGRPGPLVSVLGKHTGGVRGTDGQGCGRFLPSPFLLAACHLSLGRPFGDGDSAQRHWSPGTSPSLVSPSPTDPPTPPRNSLIIWTIWGWVLFPDPDGCLKSASTRGRWTSRSGQQAPCPGPAQRTRGRQDCAALPAGPELPHRPPSGSAVRSHTSPIPSDLSHQLRVPWAPASAIGGGGGERRRLDFT